MCRSKSKITRWLLGLVVLTAIAGMSQMAYGQGVGGSATPTFSSPLVVGQTGAPATLAVHNASTGTTDATFSNIQLVICKNGDFGFVGGVGECSAGNDLSGSLTFGTTGTGVYTPGTGDPNLTNAACTGAWTIATSGNRITFTPSATLVMFTATSGNNGGTCTISFTMGATAVPGGGTTGVAFGNGATNITANKLSDNSVLNGTGTGQTNTTIESCVAVVDKQVSCTGNANDWHDVGLTTNNTDPGGTNPIVCPLDGFNNVASNVHFQYFAQNTGGAPMTCTFADNQNGTGGVQGIFVLDANNKVTLNVGAASSQLNSTSVTQACTTAFASKEPNTGTLSCTCPTSTNNVNVTAFDEATVDCKSAGVSLTKNCADQVNGVNHVTYTASNTGNVDLTACTITDTAYLTALTCPQSNTDVGTTETVNGGVFGLAAGVSNFTTPDSADISSASANFCNTAHISCSTGTGTATADSSTVCNVPPPPGNCITRTPGYWGTHPSQTDSVIAGSLDSCGLTLTGFGLPTVNLSAVEDLCESNIDAASNNDTRTSSQQLQLIRQCTAAAINLKLSGNGSITAGEQACSSFPNITTTFTNCCVGTGSTCDSGQSAQAISNSGCITTLDAFNNQFDNVSFPAGGITDSPADSSFCGLATGNHFVNVDRNLGPAANGK